MKIRLRAGATRLADGTKVSRGRWLVLSLGVRPRKAVVDAFKAAFLTFRSSATPQGAGGLGSHSGRPRRASSSSL